MHIKYGVISALISLNVNKQNHWRKEENRKRDEQKHRIYNSDNFF